MKNNGSMGTFIKAFIVVCALFLSIEAFAKEKDEPIVHKDGSVTFSKEQAQELGKVLYQQQMLIEYLKRQAEEAVKALRSAKCV